jgi:hypothetical protein
MVETSNKVILGLVAIGVQLMLGKVNAKLGYDMADTTLLKYCSAYVIVRKHVENIAIIPQGNLSLITVKSRKTTGLPCGFCRG